MENYQKKFSEVLADSEALFFDKGLSLKDGRPTPYFVNSGKFNTGKMSAILGENFADMLMENDLVQEKDIIFGPSYKGSAISGTTAISLWNKHGLEVFFEYDRKEAKTHGESTQKESSLVNKTLFDGCRIFIVDDVWTSGATKYESIEIIEEEAKAKGDVVNIFGMGIAVDREQVGAVYDETKPKDLPNKERVILGKRGEDSIGSFITQTGIPVISIVGIRDTVNHLFNIEHPLMINGKKQPMDFQILREFNNYMDMYGVKR